MTDLFDSIRAFSENGVEEAIDAERDIAAWWSLLCTIREAGKHLNEAAATVEDVLIDTIGDSVQSLPDGRALRVRHSPKAPSYDSEGIVKRLYALAMEQRVSPDGEVLEPEGDAVLRVLCKAAPILTPSFKWRDGELKSLLGDSVDEFRSVNGWNHRITVQ